jgi:hypothetical protein
VISSMLRQLRWTRSGVVAGTIAIALAGFFLPVAATAATGPVSNIPASGTPALANTGTPQVIRQLVQCGSTMYAVGSFTTIQWNGGTYTRNNIFSFSANSPFTISSWNPDVNGEVNSIAFNGSNCADAYIGGHFNLINGAAAGNIAEIDTGTGAIVSTFKHSASNKVETLVSYNNHIIVGGYYSKINGSSANPYLTSLNSSTGADDGFVHLGITGVLHYCNASGTRCTTSDTTHIYNQQLSHGGTLDLVEGNFTSAGGQSRQQIFMLDLSGSAAVVTPWTSSAFNQHCWFTEAFYIRAASWSPDDSTVYTASTGFHTYDWNGTFPLPGLCDTAAAFPATQTSVSPKWINYTGCDSLYATAADTGAAYFAGHERWSQNPDGCNVAGPGAISDPGMEGLAPDTGKDLLNSSGSALYTRSRGTGADDMLVTGAGLWIASDNGNLSKSGQFFYSQKCNGVSGHAGICFLP